MASDSGPGPTLISGIPSVDKRRASWVGIWQLTAWVTKKGDLVYLYNDNNPKLETHMGDGPAVVTDGYGGWEDISRTRDKPLSQWVGGKGFVMQVPLLITGLDLRGGGRRPRSIESRIRRLEQMSRYNGGHSEPPPVAITLPGDSPRDGDSFVWVIDNIEWGNSRRRDSDGHRILQEATLTCKEYVRPDLVKLSPAKKRKVQKKKPKRHNAPSHKR